VVFEKPRCIFVHLTKHLMILKVSQNGKENSYIKIIQKN
jgi:hypothetical protein